MSVQVKRHDIEYLIELLEDIKKKHGNIRVEGMEYVRVVEVRNHDFPEMVVDTYIEWRP